MAKFCFGVSPEKNALDFGNLQNKTTSEVGLLQDTPESTTSSTPSKPKVNPAMKVHENESGTHQKLSGFWGLIEPPWRKVDWTEENREKLMKSISSYKPRWDSVPLARVLLLGPVGAGKSSFISSVQSVFSGRVTNRAMVGSTSTSFTKKLQSFNIPGRDRCDQSEHRGLALCDVMGLCEGEMTGLTLCDILATIKGHVPEGHKFRPEQPVTAETFGYVKMPSAADRIHCVAFVIDATKIDFYAKGLRTTFCQLREHISDLGVHQVALLTHVDKVCPETARDVANVYRSRLLQQVMLKAGAFLGMPNSYIVPVKNYSSELELDSHSDTLLLCAVDHILQYVDLGFLGSAEPKNVSSSITARRIN